LGENEVAALREMFLPEVADKPANLQEQILTGKVNARLKEIVLLDQLYIKDETKTITDLLSAASQKFGERVDISKFSCFSVQ
jgi:elongation factor Ts